MSAVPYTSGFLFRFAVFFFKDTPRFCLIQDDLSTPLSIHLYKWFPYNVRHTCSYLLISELVKVPVFMGQMWTERSRRLKLILFLALIIP